MKHKLIQNEMISRWITRFITLPHSKVGRIYTSRKLCTTV